MSLHHSPRIITDNLALYVDAANPKSYLQSAGSTVFDLSKSSADGTLLGGYVVSDNAINFTADSSGRCFHLTNLADINNITNTSSFTFSSLFRVNSFPSVQVAQSTGLLMKGSYNPSYGLNINYSGDTGGVRNTAKVYYGIRNLSGTAGSPGYGILDYTSSANLSLGQWYKVDFVHEFSDATTHVLRLYVNGVLDRVEAPSSSVYPINFQNSTDIGVNSRIIGGNFLYSDLTVSQYAIYTKALSANEVMQNFNAIRGRYGL